MSSHAFQAGLDTYGSLGFTAGEFESRIAQAERSNKRVRDSLHLEDFYLVLGIERKNPSAWRQFDKLYRAKLYAWAWNVVRNQADAEDIVQNVLVEMQGKELTYEGVGPLGAWLQRYAKCRALDMFRSKKRGKVKVENSIAQGAVPTDPLGDTAAHFNCIHFITECVDRGLEQMGQPCKTILVLLYKHGLKKKEIAVAVDMKDFELSRKLPKCHVELACIIRRMLNATYSKVPADIEDCLHLLRSH